MSRRARWLRVAEALVAAGVLAFLIVFLARHAGAVTAHPWSLEPIRLGVATAILAGAYSAMVALWRIVLDRLGGRLSLLDAHRIWYLANLGRYAPGKVLQLAGTGWLVRAKGVPARVGIGSALAAQAILLVAGAAVAAAALPADVAGPGLRAAGIAVAIALPVLCATPLVERLVRLGGRWIGRDAGAFALPARDRILLVGGYLGVWVGLGVSFWLFVEGVGAGELPLVAAIGIHAAGYLAGYLAVVVPGGLGVREGAYAALLGLHLPPPVAVAVALLARLWSTLVELAVGFALLARFGVTDLRAPIDPGSRTR